MVIPARFERATPRLGIWCSILLSYGTTWTASIQKARREAKLFSGRSANTGRACLHSIRQLLFGKPDPV